MKSLFLVVLSVLLGLGSAFAQNGSNSRVESDVTVLRVPVEGQIDRATVRLVQRALERAADDPNLGRVVLDINSPGEADSALDLLENLVSNVLAADQVEVSAYIRSQAFSGGAFLALSCDQVYMSRRAQLGAITPVLRSFWGLDDSDSNETRDRLIDSFRARVRDVLSQRGATSPAQLLLADALVDDSIRLVELTYLTESGLQETKLVRDSELSSYDPDSILRQRPLETPLTLSSDTALEYGLCTARFDQLEDLVRDEFGLPTSSIRTMESNWSESFVSWIESFKLLLFLFGFIALMIEAKTPGLVIPGVLGVLAIATALFSSVMLGLADWVEVLFFVIGLGLIAVEIFLVPGTMIAGLFGLLSMVFGLILTQQTFFWPSDPSQEAIMFGNVLDVVWLALGLIVGSILVFTFLPKIPILNRLQLKAPEPAFATGASGRFTEDSPSEASAWTGRVLRAVSDLRPSGIAEADDRERVDVSSTGGFVAAGARVRVVEVSGNRFLVEPVEDKADVSDPEAGAADWGMIVFLLIVALALSIGEVFLVSFGLLGLTATGCAIAAIVMTFAQAGQVAGYLVLVGTAVFIPGIAWLFYKHLADTWVGRMMFLQGPDPGSQTAAAEDPEIASLVGQRGRTESPLRPAGIARIGGRRIDVTTRGELIDSGAQVEVLQTDGNRVVVREASATASDSPVAPSLPEAEASTDQL
ncbi:MAG: NfeD family protein [Planctomycetota bacterium]